MFNYLFVIFVLLTYTGCFYDTNGLIYQNGTSVDPSYVQIHVDTSSVLLPIDDDSSEKVAAKMVDTFELKRIRNEVINISSINRNLG
ncbi:MAG: hypothetical protein RLZ10_3126 [Bacteroidota bacterium]|jgi:hypothetical protein